MATKINVNGRAFDLEVEEVFYKTIVKLAGVGYGRPPVSYANGVAGASGTLQRGEKVAVTDGMNFTVTIP